jgi:hypothetical protein
MMGIQFDDHPDQKYPPKGSRNEDPECRADALTGGFKDAPTPCGIEPHLDGSRAERGEWQILFLGGSDLRNDQSCQNDREQTGRKHPFQSHLFLLISLLYEKRAKNIRAVCCSS